MDVAHELLEAPEAERRQAPRLRLISDWAGDRDLAAVFERPPRRSACVSHAGGVSPSFDRLGSLAPGFRSDIAALGPQTVPVLATWVAGAGNVSP